MNSAKRSKKERAKIPEREYRASRICRILGNPTAYRALKLIGKDKKRPSELAEKLNVSVATISVVLRHLREIDILRYEVRWKERVYFLKVPEILNVLEEIEKITDKIKKIKE